MRANLCIDLSDLVHVAEVAFAFFLHVVAVGQKVVVAVISVDAATTVTLAHAIVHIVGLVTLVIGE